MESQPNTKKLVPKLNSIYCLLSILGYCNSLEKVAPKIIQLNKFFKKLIESNLENGNLFKVLQVKEVCLTFSEMPGTIEQQYKWWH